MARYFRNRLSSPRSRSIVPPLKPLKNVQTMDARERSFLDAAERGDKATVQLHLQDVQRPVNVNCTNLLGRTAMEIAVDNENVEIVEVLLQQPGIKIGNALLYAIREGVFRIVELLINHPSITKEMLGEGWSSSLEKQEAENFEYPSDISPVMLAAHLNQFEILQLLLGRGATIRKPHSQSCSCTGCQEERLVDSLHHSLHRIHTYRALASPAWISLTSSDPVMTSFRLSWELQKLSDQECEFKEIYWQLSEQCKAFACDLLNQCRSTEEVIAVLNKDVSDDPDDIWDNKLSLARLKFAIKYEQKQFVSHSHCQQLLTSIWYEGFPGRQERGSVVNIFLCFLLIMAWPIVAVCYIVMPHSRAGRIVRSPFMKFLYYSTSFGCFLFLLTMATFEGYGDDYDLRADQRGPKPSIVETLIVIWVLGMVWTEVKQLWNEGFYKYVHQWWNWLDFIMMALYLSTISLRAIAYYYMQNESRLSRKWWKADEPTLVAESLFAVANVLSFARIIYLFQTNPYLGPLQISLGCMLLDIAKFFVIFFLILTSFAIGMAQLYWWNKPEPPMTYGFPIKEYAFSSIANSYTTLLWSLFSITDTTATDVSNANATFTEWIGRGMFIAYHVTSIIVLLNMLIAMMSHSFQIINDHADLEWKFHRTKLWISYFDEGSSLPAPFNIVLTPKSLYYGFRALCNMLRWITGRYSWETRRKRATIKRPGYEKRRQKQMDDEHSTGGNEKLTYQDIMRRLVSRYIHQTKKAMKMDGVSEDDLLEIKQDISSLRFELREDRRKEIARSSSHIDGVKKEILRTLSTSGPRHLCTRYNRSETDERDQITPSSVISDDFEPPSPPSMPTSLVPSARRTPSTSAFSFRRRPINVLDLENLKREIIETITDRLAKQLEEALGGQTPQRYDSRSTVRADIGGSTPSIASSTVAVPSRLTTAITIDNPVVVAGTSSESQEDASTSSKPVSKVLHV